TSEARLPDESVSATSGNGVAAKPAGPADTTQASGYSSMSRTMSEASRESNRVAMASSLEIEGGREGERPRCAEHEVVRPEGAADRRPVILVGDVIDPETHRHIGRTDPHCVARTKVETGPGGNAHRVRGIRSL